MKSYPENLNAKEVYDMIKSPAIQKLSDAVGQVMGVTAYVLREEANSNGEIQKVLNIRDERGVVYGTSSKPFIREFENVCDIVKGDMSQLNHIEVISGKSKAGRTFITMVWVD